MKNRTEISQCALYPPFARSLHAVAHKKFYVALMPQQFSVVSGRKCVISGHEYTLNEVASSHKISFSFVTFTVLLRLRIAYSKNLNRNN